MARSGCSKGTNVGEICIHRNNSTSISFSQIIWGFSTLGWITENWNYYFRPPCWHKKFSLMIFKLVSCAICKLTAGLFGMNVHSDLSFYLREQTFCGFVLCGKEEIVWTNRMNSLQRCLRNFSSRKGTKSDFYKTIFFHRKILLARFNVRYIRSWIFKCEKQCNL